MGRSSAVALVCVCLLSCERGRDAAAFSASGRSRPQRAHHVAPLSVSASELLYQDQAEAMLRRATKEEELINSKRKSKELTAPKLKAKGPKAGTGFGGGAASKASMDPAVRLAEEQAKVVHRDGVLRIDGTLSAGAADGLRAHLLKEQQYAAMDTEKNPMLSRAYYGVENARKSRCDLQLGLLRGGYGADDADARADSHPVADALQELLGTGGTLRPLYENLVTLGGEFYELAGIITNPGSNRQMVHPDLPFRKDAPLYVIFLALQDVTEEMGPTSFLLKTHTAKANNIFNGDKEGKDEQLASSDCRLATLKKGDAVLFDARTLHCGNGNGLEMGSTRVMFNFSFRNPKVLGDIGYAGSMMPGYVKAMTLGDLGEALDVYREGDENPFAKYGNGLQAVGRSSP